MKSGHKTRVARALNLIPALSLAVFPHFSSRATVVTATRINIGSPKKLQEEHTRLQCIDDGLKRIFLDPGGNAKKTGTSTRKYQMIAQNNTRLLKVLPSSRNFFFRRKERRKRRKSLIMMIPNLFSYKRHSGGHSRRPRANRFLVKYKIPLLLLSLCHLFFSLHVFRRRTFHRKTFF